MEVRGISSPGRLMGALIAFQCLILVAVPYAFSWAPPLDVVEGLVWAPHWLIGTYKHPPLPSWLIEASVLLTQNVILGPYLVSQLCTGLTYYFVYRLGRILMDPMRGAAGALLMAGTYYFTVPTLEFNHNVVQLPFWSGAVLLFALLRQKPDSWTLWLSLGALGGLGLYGKYTFAILLLILFGLALYETQTRKAFATAKPYLSIALASLIFSPHLAWLVQHHFEPFTYAIDRGEGGNTSRPLAFLLAQIADHLPLMLILVSVGIGGLLRSEKTGTGRADKIFLHLITFGPVVLTLALFLVSGTSGKDMWGMPMFTPLGLWLVMELGRPWTMPQLTRGLVAAMGLILLIGIGFMVHALAPYFGKPPRSNWPMKDISVALERLWKERTDQPLTIIGGTPFVAGLAALGQARRTDVMIGSDIVHSPWLTEVQIRQNGIAFIFDHDEAIPALCGPLPFKTTVTLADPLMPKLTAIICPPQPIP